MITTRDDIEFDALPKAFDGFAIAHISDLHNRDFGCELIKKTEENKPDIIVITGDMIHIEKQTAAAEKFAMGAVQLAPVYYVPGNHEKVLKCYPEFIEFLRGTGVRVLENEYAEIERGDEKIALLGMNDPAFFEKGKTDFLIELNNRKAQIDESGIGFTVLLSHRPELFPRYAEAKIDLSLCGHTHGGHVRLPLIGAFYAPNQGLFPKYADGKFAKNGKVMIISKGLGKSSWVPRFCNPPELTIEVLHSAAKTIQTQSDSCEE